MNPIANLIIEKNKELITKTTINYKVFGVPAFIRIETGIHDRNIVSPNINVFIENKNLDFYEQWFNGFNPVSLIRRLPNKNELYLEAFTNLVPGQALIAIDYEGDNVRELFDPIVWSGE